MFEECCLVSVLSFKCCVSHLISCSFSLCVSPSTVPLMLLSIFEAMNALGRRCGFDVHSTCVQPLETLTFSDPHIDCAFLHLIICITMVRGDQNGQFVH